MDDIRFWIEAEGSGHYFFIAFPVCLLILFILLRGRRLRFVVPGLLMSLVIVNPLFYRYWDALDLYAYWRMLWVVPVVSVVAGVVPAITEKTRKTGMKGIAVVVGVVLIVFGGTYLYDGAGGAFTFPASNAAKLPGEVLEIADYLTSLEEHPRVALVNPLGTYIRQFSGDIDILYGRDISGFIYRASSEALTVSDQLNDPQGDLEKVATALANNGYDYLVVNEKEDHYDFFAAGYEHLSTISGYSVFRVHGNATMVKERNELGQVISITMVDSQGNPVNGQSGYAKVTYEYDSYGNIIRDLRTDVDGNGVANLNGIAEWRRRYDRFGHILMERYLDPAGEPVLNSMGYAELRRIYSNDCIVCEAYFDTEGKPVNRIDTLYATVRMSYDRQGRRIESRYYDAGNHLVCSSDGYACIRWIYEERQTITEVYYDTANGRTLVPKGYASVTRVYDEQWRVVSESYYDIDGAPTDCLDGYAIVLREYGDGSNITRESFLDKDGNPVVTPSGYARVQRIYEGKNLIHEAYFGTDGEPMRQKAGFVAFAQEWNKDKLISRVYLDADGNPVMRTDGYSKAVWVQDELGIQNIHLENLSGTEVSLEGRNLAKDISSGADGWSEWMTPVPNTINSCFNIGQLNLGAKHEGDSYASRIEIEFRNVTATPDQEWRFWTQGAQDGKWFTGNVWNSSLVNLFEIPKNGVYSFTSVVEVTEPMTKVSTFDLGFRCDYWRSGSFRVRSVKVEKENPTQTGETDAPVVTWSPGI